MNKQRIKRFTFFLWGLFSPLILSARTVVLPVEAIEESKYLPAEDFERLYPGIDISDYVLDEEGWYVRYIHKNLTYFFGPIDDYSDAQTQKGKLEKIRKLVIAQRPSLNNSTVDLIRFTFDSGQTVVSGDKNEEAFGEGIQSDQKKPESSSERPPEEKSQITEQESAEEQKENNRSQDLEEGGKPESTEEQKFSILKFIKSLFGF